MRGNWERLARALLAALGGRLVLIAIALLSLGWFVTAPISIERHATAEPFRVDYLAFDTAGTIIADGDAPRLYEPLHQRDVQKRRAGNDEPSYIPYLNPPILGAAYVPFAALDARAGYVASVALLALALSGATALLYRTLDGWSRRARLLACLCLLGSTASASALISAQLTPLLLAVSACALLAFRARRAGLAGATLGLLVIKPHVALAAFVVLLLVRQWKAALAMSCVAFAAIAASLLILGVEGSEQYVALMRRSFSHPASIYIDVRTEQNIAGFLASAFQVYGGTWAGLASSTVVLAGLLLAYRALAASPYAGVDQVHYVAAVTATFVVATAPHIHFYDLGLLALPAWFILRRAAVQPAAVRPRYYGLLALMVFGIEFAGMLASAEMSFSFPALAALLLTVCAWPRVESWLATPVVAQARSRSAA